ncbi:hypothetical protein BVC80_8951g39 [Macleaya cordata]|uniref:Uncharacterized protein n=1 Tax=Macleaya cordata TaxID=56857 RepID=A0A200QWU0_MACCD|nr:hypothetical protein BVC80_8951g39 [Macleaya cordata]
MNKKTGITMASVAAVSATAISASSSSSDFFVNTKTQASISHRQDAVSKAADRDNQSLRKSTDKFSPRFDGLRFIETLVTGHR